MQVKFNVNDNQIMGPGVQTQTKQSEHAGQKSSQSKRTNTIFAGDLPINKDSITVRKQQAQKKAMKMIQDAWDVDRKAKQGTMETQEKAQQWRAEALMNQEKVAECEERKEKFRQGYGVDEDSQEQKDLELLERAMYPSGGELTEEEEKRLEELQNQPLTEYQQKCLEVHKEQYLFQNRAESAESVSQYYAQSATSMKIERLKFHKMADAQDNAEKLLTETGKQIVGMLWEEAKDHVDETYEEKREEEKEKAEEKEEQEEKVEDIREEKEILEERIETVREDSRETEKANKEQERNAREEAELLKSMADAGMDVAGSGEGVKAEIKDMLNKMKLLEADIKGIEVDEEI